MTARSFCFTVNNWKYMPKKLPKHGRYAVVGEEGTDDGQTPHLQGYIEFTQPQRLRAVQKWLKCKAHVEQRNGTREGARTYCMKEGHYKELGSWREGGRGNRTDISALYKASRDPGRTIVSIADEFPRDYMKYWKAVKHVRQLGAVDKPPIRVDLEVHLYEGPPGSGKTRQAYELHPDLYAVPVGKDLWFDNYAGEEVVLIDDFAGEMKLTQLLRLLDKFPIQVPCKGSFVWFKPMKVIITTNVPYDRWYDFCTRQDSLAALVRRITSFFRFFEDERPCSQNW